VKRIIIPILNSAVVLPALAAMRKYLNASGRFCLTSFPELRSSPAAHLDIDIRDVKHEEEERDDYLAKEKMGRRYTKVEGGSFIVLCGRPPKPFERFDLVLIDAATKQIAHCL
jgi:hypothetical protein